MIIPPKLFTHPFTCAVNLTTPGRRTLETRFYNSAPRCTFLPRNTYQLFLKLKDVAMYLLRLSDINSMRFATDIPKRSGIQKKKNTLNGYHCTNF